MEPSETEIVVDTEGEPFRKNVYIFSYAKSHFEPKRSEKGLMMDITVCG